MQRNLNVGLIIVLIASVVLAAQSLPVRAQVGGVGPAWDDFTPGQWNQVATEGDTRCLYGAPYSFFVRPATVESNKLMIFFQGGGACWDGVTCADRGSFAHEFDVQPEDASQFVTGVFDFDNPANPLRDYNTVFVPYCTGDVFAGDAAVTFNEPEPLTVYFNGYRNTQAVLNWTFEALPEPSQVFVTGASAGGYGATIYAPTVMEHYPGVPVVHLSDGGVGVMPENLAVLNTWGADSSFDVLLDNIMQPETLMNDLLVTAANIYPDATFAYFTTYADLVQVTFYGLMAGYDLEAGGELLFLRTTQEWFTQMVADIERLNAETDNFRSYIAGGGIHTILLRPEFYHYTVEGVPVRQWLIDLLAGEADSVMCDVAAGDCLRAPRSR